jgi:hypothetical protein
VSRLISFLKETKEVVLPNWFLLMIMLYMAVEALRMVLEVCLWVFKKLFIK